MNTSDLITWLSVLVAIFAFANEFHRIKIKILHPTLKIISILWVILIFFFSVIYPKNFLNFSDFIKNYDLILNFDFILSFFYQKHITSELVALLLSLLLTGLIVYKIFLNKKLDFKSKSGIKSSIILIDEIYNEGEKMYPQLAQILEDNIEQIIKILTDEKVKKIEKIKPEIQNQNKVNLDNTLSIILTDEKFLKFLVKRQIGINLFLACYKKFDKDKYYRFGEKQISILKFIERFVKTSLQNKNSKFYTFLEKDIQNQLSNELFTKVERIKDTKLMDVFMIR